MSVDRGAGPALPDPAITLRRAGEADLPAICLLGLEVNNLHHEARPDIYAGNSDVPGRDRAKPCALTPSAHPASPPDPSRHGVAPC